MSLEFRLPELGENIKQGDVVKVFVKAGDFVKKDQPLIEVETDKAAVEVPSNAAGRVVSVLVKVGEKVKPGQVLMTLDAVDAAPAPRAGPQAGAAIAPHSPAPAAPAPASVPLAGVSEPSAASGPAAPSVRKFAREIGVDIGQVRGSGAEGRISIDDVKAFARARAAAPSGGRPAPVSLPDLARWGGVESKPMSAVRRATARHMANAWTRIPHVTQHDKADVTAFEQFRKGQKAKMAGVDITVTALAVKVCAAALKRFPQFNVSVDEAREAVIYKSYCHIGVAVDTERGLLVPVLRDADKKGLKAVAAEITGLAGRAREKKLGVDDMQGGCFTITNLGGIGGSAFTPIVNWPEVAILGLSRSAWEPVWQEGEFVPRLIMPLSLSYDHRVIDGADGARFLRWVAEALAQPLVLALEDGNG